MTQLISPENQLLFLLTRQQVSDEQRSQIQEISQTPGLDWQLVFETANTHRVAPLLFHNLNRLDPGMLGVPKKVLGLFKQTQIHNVLTKKNTQVRLNKVFRSLAQHGLEFMLIKGEAYNLQVYDQPWYTVSKDVDLLIRKSAREIEPGLLQELTEFFYSNNRQPSPLLQHLEYDFYSHHDLTMNEVLRTDPAILWRDSRSLQFEDHKIFVLSDEDMFLSAAINACRRRFFFLKATLDLAEIIQRCPDLNWDAVIEKSLAYECNTILYTALMVTQNTLGCVIPFDLRDCLRVSSSRAAMIRRLIGWQLSRFTLQSLAAARPFQISGRSLSWPLILTYTTYHSNHIPRKLKDVYVGWQKSRVYAR